MQTSQASRSPGGCQSQQMLLGKHRGRWRFPMELDRYQNEQCWAMEKTWLFRLHKGLYYPIILEFLEENMGNFWEFWNLDFVFLVPSLCRYSKTDLSDFAKKGSQLYGNFLKKTWAAFENFGTWILFFWFLHYAAIQKRIFLNLQKNNYMGISWRKHGQLLRIFGTWILFFFGSFTMPLFKTGSFWFCKKTQLYGNFLKKTWATFENFWNLDFVFLVPSLCRYSKQDLSDFAKKTNYMGISWRKHGQLLRIFGTWILFFLVPSLCRYSKQDLSDFAKKTQLYGNFLKKTWATFENFWNLDFVFLVPSLCRYSKQDLSDFAKKTNYMGISWRKHGQLLRIFGTWILFFWFLHYAAIQNRIFLILQKTQVCIFNDSSWSLGLTCRTRTNLPRPSTLAATYSWNYVVGVERKCKRW